MTAIFPKLRGLKAERDIGASFKTVIHRAASGRRAAMGQRFFPVHRFNLRYEFLRASPSAQDLQTLRGFFIARRGPLDPFFLQDPDRCKATVQAVGLGAPGQLAYPLVYTEGDSIDRIGGVDLTGVAPVALVNGAAVAATFTRNQLVLGSPAATGAAVAWTGNYFFHVAFVEDSLTFKRFMQQLYSADGVAVETVNLHD